jgi:cyclase
MLKKRIAAVIIVKDNIVVQSINFKKYLPVGKPAIALEFLNSWGIDEIILLDISASSGNRPPDFAMVGEASKRSYVPLTVGGGITNIDNIKDLMHAGVDKISLNQSALKDTSLISKAANIFGNQCVVVSIDAIKVNGKYRVYDHMKKIPTELDPQTFAKLVCSEGAGEILINSVDRDGSYLGYDLALINSVCEVVSVPVICCGGAKNAKDFVTVFENTNVSAAAAANFFHFSEHSVNISKAFIKKSMDVRLETNADYHDAMLSEDLRLVKKDDSILEKMLYLRIEKEII